MKDYVKSCRSDFWQQVSQKELDYIKKELVGCHTILSVGCGPAMIERGLLKKGLDITGLDVSKDALEGSPDEIRKVVGSAEKMDLCDNIFDAVLFIVSLQFISNYQKAIDEAFRVLKSGGKLIVFLLNPESKFFKGKMDEEDSYIKSIKHVNNEKIEEYIRKRFIIRTEYFLGIDNKKLFESDDKAYASIYSIIGNKKPVEENKNGTRN